MYDFDNVDYAKMTWEEVERTDIPGWSRLFLVYDKSNPMIYPRIFVTNSDRSAAISIAAYEGSRFDKAREDAGTIQVPLWAYECCWHPDRMEEMLGGLAPIKAAPRPSPPTVQELLVTRYGTDAWVEIHCSGWANYKSNPDNGEPWKYDFSIKAGAWDDDCFELSELMEYEFETFWGLLDMSEAAWVNKLVITIGEDVFTREYPSYGDEQLRAKDLESGVEKALRGELRTEA